MAYVGRIIDRLNGDNRLGKKKRPVLGEISSNGEAIRRKTTRFRYDTYDIVLYNDVNCWYKWYVVDY